MTDVDYDPSEHADLTDDTGEYTEPAGEQGEPLNVAVDDRKLVTQPYDLAVKGLSQDIETDRIRLSIEYQRKYVWDTGKASRLIESLLLNIPIPVCYFAEDENGAYEVIDGLQRLTTISRYLDNKLRLTGLSVLTELNGKRFDELEPRDMRRLENRTIRCIVITEDSNPDIKFDVFERLNTGAAMLTAQELRNSVYRGPFNDALKGLAKEPSFTALMGGTANTRMDHEELVLRFFSLVHGIETYKPPLRQFLNSYMRQNRKTVPSDAQVSLFRDCCTVVGHVMGDAPFRGVNSKNPVNKAMFDALMVTLAFADRAEVLDSAADVKVALEHLTDNEGFQMAIGRATADRRRMLYRLRYTESRLRECGVTVELPVGIETLDALSYADDQQPT